MSSQQRIKLYTVDAFTDRPFKGNPAAVCPLSYDTNLDDELLQKIAMEMNLSETAYIRPLDAKDDHKTGKRFGLRWFTPTHEIKLCGHATLASAATLYYATIGNTSDMITFETLSGDLFVKKDGDYLSMDFPIGTTEEKSASDYEGVIKSLGAPADVPGVQDVRWCPSLKYLLVRFRDGMTRKQFEEWRPDIGKLERSVTGVIVVIATIRGSKKDGFADGQGREYDFLSRSFAPWSGTAEDPVTGSSHTVLAHYWAPILNKTNFYARQCSRRGGEMEVVADGKRVHLRGKAVLVMEGVLRL